MSTRINSEMEIILTKITAALNELMLSCHRVREIYFVAVIFAAVIFAATTICKLGRKSRLSLCTKQVKCNTEKVTI